MPPFGKLAVIARGGVFGPEPNLFILGAVSAPSFKVGRVSSQAECLKILIRRAAYRRVCEGEVR